MLTKSNAHKLKPKHESKAKPKLKAKPGPKPKHEIKAKPCVGACQYSLSLLVLC